MKVVTSLVALASVANAHYNFPALIYNGVTHPWYSHVRLREDVNSHGPVTDVFSLALRCGLNAPPAANILPVTAGSTLGFTLDPTVQHPGPTAVYLAKVPAGQTAKTWDGAGSVWFKIFQIGATFPGGKLTWPSDGLTAINFKIPSATPSGDYLVRVEHIGLHGAGQVGGAQFYGSCGQITITGGGSGNPGPKIAIPGDYDANHPGIKIGIYWPPVTSYTPPGPAVWTG